MVLLIIHGSIGIFQSQLISVKKLGIFIPINMSISTNKIDLILDCDRFKQLTFIHTSGAITTYNAFQNHYLEIKSNYSLLVIVQN